jgi:D-alanyl-D-alanine carboxypeptidase (penicillin-binding protein 5/6)
MKMLLDKPAPYTTAQSWVVIDQESSKLLFGRCEKERREVASLTKMMTALTVLTLVDKMKLDMSTELVTVPELASQAGGTSADLIVGD